MSQDKLRLVYDGDCSLCVNAAKTITRWDRRGRFEAVPFSDPRAEKLLSVMDRETFFGSFHLVLPDGTVKSGSEAIPDVLAALPGGRPASWLLVHAPGAKWMSARIYDWISRRRG